MARWQHAPMIRNVPFLTFPLNYRRLTTTRIPPFGLSVISGSGTTRCPGTRSKVTRWTRVARANCAAISDMIADADVRPSAEGEIGVARDLRLIFHCSTSGCDTFRIGPLRYSWPNTSSPRISACWLVLLQRYLQRQVARNLIFERLWRCICWDCKRDPAAHPLTSS